MPLKRSIEVPFILIVSALTVFGTANLIHDANRGSSDAFSKWLEGRVQAILTWIQAQNARTTSSNHSGLDVLTVHRLDNPDKVFQNNNVHTQTSTMNVLSDVKD
jgi:hypothetical protein